jgi:hypothetical protein
MMQFSKIFNTKEKEMKSRNLIAILSLFMIFVTTDVALAHHSFAMFDRDKEEVLEGTVVRWAFNSPHIALYIETEDGTLYGLEGAAPASLITRSPAMNGFTFQPGEHVVVVQCPLRDGRAGGAIGIIITDDDTHYRPNDGGCGASQQWNEWLAAGYMSKAEAEMAN